MSGECVDICHSKREDLVKKCMNNALSKMSNGSTSPIPTDSNIFSYIPSKENFVDYASLIIKSFMWNSKSYQVMVLNIIHIGDELVTINSLKNCFPIESIGLLTQMTFRSIGDHRVITKDGKLIGKTTWGGLIGISANRSTIDGGRVVVPFFRFFTPDNEWRVENEGVAPDIDVDLNPVLVNQGRDSQLEAGINEVLKQLESFKPIKLDKAPAFPTKLGQ